MAQTRVVTELLRRARDSGDDAAREILPHIYEDLRALAARVVSDGRAPTLQPTELVHEAFARLVDKTQLEANDRAHFLAIAARAMRMVLADHARRRRADKRGGDRRHVTLDSAGTPSAAAAVDLVELDDVLAELERLDRRHARIVELRFFAGFTVAEVAREVDCSVSTVESDWRLIRAWLGRALQGDGGTPNGR